MSHRPSTRRRVLGALVVSPLLLAAACGSDDGEETAAAEETPAETESPENEDTDTQAPESTDDGSDGGEDGEVAPVCELLTDEEISEAVGFDVVGKESNTMQLPVCEWELSVPEDAGMAGLPLFSLVLMPEGDYQSRTDPIADILQDIDGLGDEAKFAFSGGSGMPSMASLFVLEGDQGFQMQPGVTTWDDEAAARDAFTELGEAVLDRL